MRAFVFLLLLSLLCLPVLANEEDAPVLPFAYVQQDTSFNFFVMDANSQEILYSFERDNYFDCPYLYSENREWLLHGTYGQAYLLNLLSFETFDLVEAIRRPTWSSDGNQLAYYIDYANIAPRTSPTTSLYLENLRTGQREIIEELLNVEAIRFVEDDLLYAYIEETEIVLSRWNGNEILRVSFERLESDWISVSISPNGQFLAVTYRYNSNEIPDTLYLIDSRTGIAQEISYGGVIWQPLKPASFALVRQGGEIALYDAISGRSEIINSEPRNFSYFIDWSPDGSYLAVSLSIEGGTDHPANDILLFNLETGETQQLYQSSISYEWGMEWLSETQFVYTYASPRISGEPDYDIYLYDVVSHQNVQLTFTPDISEQLGCVQ